MTMSLFKKAERKQSKIKILLEGPSGSGKTMSALLLAKGFGGKTCFIDTENGSASLYDNIMQFAVYEMDKPFSYEKYLYAMKKAEEAGYDNLIIDSMSHGWLDLLEQKGIYDESMGRSSFSSWEKWGHKQNEFVASILACNLHVICCSRAKQDYVVDERGRPQKVGLKAVQRMGVEYEFTTSFRIDMQHYATVDKDRTQMFRPDRSFLITEETGKQYMKWLKGNIKPEYVVDRTKELIEKHKQGEA